MKLFSFGLLAMAQAGLVDRVDDRVFTDFKELNIDGQMVDFAEAYEVRFWAFLNIRDCRIWTKI